MNVSTSRETNIRCELAWLIHRVQNNKVGRDFGNHCARLSHCVTACREPLSRQGLSFPREAYLLVALMVRDPSQTGTWGPRACSLTSCLPGSGCCSFPPVSSPAPLLSVPTGQTQRPVGTKAHGFITPWLPPLLGLLRDWPSPWTEGNTEDQNG